MADNHQCLTVGELVDALVRIPRDTPLEGNYNSFYCYSELTHGLEKEVGVVAVYNLDTRVVIEVEE